MKYVAVDNESFRHTDILEIAGVSCSIRTNSLELASTLCSWRPKHRKHDAVGFSMRVVVSQAKDDCATPPHFRGLDHIVIATFGGSNIFVFDLIRREISATVSAQTARTAAFWADTLFPIAVGVLGSAIGILPLHAACLEVGGNGILIAGASGVGKSTLAVALAQAGLNYVSDDWTYIGNDRHGLLAHGVGASAKLLPDAIQHFPELARFQLSVALNGELAYLLSASEAFPSGSVRFCVPQWFVFLERTTGSGCDISPIPAEQTRWYVESSVEPLPNELGAAALNRQKLIARVACLPSWRLRYGGTPQFAAQELSRFVLHMERVES
jgi:HPr Serine kinase C-terminal domain